MLNYDNLDKTLQSASASDLARIVWQGAQHNPVLMKIAILHATFISTDTESALVDVVRETATIEDHVPYAEADAYCQILDEIIVLIKRTHDQGNSNRAIQLAETAVLAAANSSENIMDGDYWEMSLEELRTLLETLKSTTA